MLLLPLAALMLSQEPSPTDRTQWLCAETAYGSGGSSVAVQAYVYANGEIMDQAALWIPPEISREVHSDSLQVADAGASQTDRANLELDATIHFDDPSKKGVGPATGILAGGFGRGEFGWLSGAKVTLELSSGFQSTENLEVFSRHPFLSLYSHLLSSTEEDQKRVLSGLEMVNIARVTFSDQKGRQVARINYDISAIAERDRLFRKAWRIVQRRVKRPTSCDKTQPMALNPPTVP